MSSQLFSVAGKSALVTGGSRGIGAMIARGLVDAGTTVYLSSRKAEVCEKVAAELSQVGPCYALPADLSREDEARRVAEELGEREPALHILVNNAGNAWNAPLDEHDDAAWDRVLGLNLKGVFHLSRFLRPMLEAAAAPGDPARIVNIGSIEGWQVPRIDTYSYAASKAGMHQLTRHLAKNLAPEITVNVVAPGGFESKLAGPVLDRIGEEILAEVPMRRWGAHDDITGTVIYLCSPAGTYITGAIIPVDGGLSACR